MSLLVMGSIVHDYFAFTSRAPNAGESVVGHRFYTGLGGKGSNQAVMAALLFEDASKVDFVGRVGKDVQGQTFLDLYSNLGMNRAQVQVDESEATGAALVVVNERDGDNRIVVVLGANMKVDMDHVTNWSKYELVLVGGCETPMPAIRKTLERAKEHNVCTVLNAAPVPTFSSAEELKNLLRLVDFLIVNETEADHLAAIIDEKRSHGTSVEGACHLLIDYVIDAIIVTLGGKGAVLMETRDKSRMTKIDADKDWLEGKRVVDTTGAGDAFVAAFCYFTMNKLELKERVRRACRVATITVTKSGTTSAYPRREELPKEIFGDEPMP